VPTPATHARDIPVSRAAEHKIERFVCTHATDFSGVSTSYVRVPTMMLI
jgi:hypothetical protein